MDYAFKYEDELPELVDKLFKHNSDWNPLSVSPEEVNLKKDDFDSFLCYWAEKILELHIFERKRFDYQFDLAERLAQGEHSTAKDLYLDYLKISKDKKEALVYLVTHGSESKYKNNAVTKFVLENKDIVKKFSKKDIKRLKKKKTALGYFLISLYHLNTNKLLSLDKALWYKNKAVKKGWENLLAIQEELHEFAKQVHPLLSITALKEIVKIYRNNPFDSKKPQDIIQLDYFDKRLFFFNLANLIDRYIQRKTIKDKIIYILENWW